LHIFKPNNYHHFLAFFLAISESRSRSPQLSDSPADDDESNSLLQFQISVNEDIDDGIEADVGDSTNEDDDPVFHTPVETIIEVYSLYKDLHQALYHLNNKLIATYEPETIRGGGLLVSSSFCFCF
jgi:hypothetical protein